MRIYCPVDISFGEGLALVPTLPKPVERHKIVVCLLQERFFFLKDVLLMLAIVSTIVYLVCFYPIAMLAGQYDYPTSKLDRIQKSSIFFS